MSTTIYIGWWLLPALITVLAYVAAAWSIPAAQPGGYFPDFGPAIIGCIHLSLATIVTLAAWLAWALWS